MFKLFSGFTCGDWQLKTCPDIRFPVHLHSTPPVTSVRLCQILSSHRENVSCFVIKNVKLTWTMLLVCLNYLFAYVPGLSNTQVFDMVSVVWLIETWDRDGASGLDWHFTHCNNVTVNSWQNNSRRSTHSGAFRCIACITISYRLFNLISVLHICYRSVLWHNLWHIMND